MKSEKIIVRKYSHLLVRTHRDRVVAVRREAHAVGEVGVAAVGVVQTERRASVEERGHVLRRGEDPERPGRAVRDGDDALVVADHLADAVAGVPHEHLGKLPGAIADRDDLLALVIPVQVLDLARENRHFNLQQALRVIPRPHADLARDVCG